MNAKKLLVLALGVVVCLTYAASASAIDSSSLESRTTEGLYDRNDAFDLARDAGLLYQVKPLHLWTVGSGYSAITDSDEDCTECKEDSSDSFLVGVARELGPGSFAAFFEANNRSYTGETSYGRYFNMEFATTGGVPYLFGPSPADPEYYPAYDGTDDLLMEYGDTERYEYEWEEYNASVAYSLDFNDWFSVGASYEPQFIDEKETVNFEPILIDLDDGLDIDLDPAIMEGYLTLLTGFPVGMPPQIAFYSFYLFGNWFTGDSLLGPDPFCWLGTDFPVSTGPNTSTDLSFIAYGDTEHTSYLDFSGSAGFDGERNTDKTVHPVNVRSHIRPTDKWDFLVGIGYASVDKQDRVSGVYQSVWDFEGELPEGLFPPYPPLSFNVKGSSDVTLILDGSMRDYAGHSGTVSWGPDGAGPTHADGGLEEDYDGDQWSVFVSPTYHFNDTCSARLDLSYAKGDGNFDGGLLGAMTFRHTFATDINGEEPNPYEVNLEWTGSSLWNGLSAGSYERLSYGIEPRIYLDFEKLRFSAGLGLAYHEDEWDGIMTLNKTTHYEFDDGNLEYVHPIDGGDYIFDGSFTGIQAFSGEQKTTTWRAPVAVEFDITDKLTARAGAAYYRVQIEEKRSDNQRIMEDEQFEVKDVAGHVVDAGPQENVVSTGGAGQPYDADAHGCGLETKLEETEDYTTYHLGMGYYFTENLQFDLMFSGMSGYVDASQLFASFTIIFP